MTDTDALLAANTAFYRAFATGDIAAMTALWDDVGPVACIHPGWPPLFGLTAVVDSWRRIMTAPPPIVADDARALFHGDCGLVLCRETIGDVSLAATNMFRLRNGAWRLIHHQAGPMRDLGSASSRDAVLH